MIKDLEHEKDHWKFTLIGSAVGFGAIFAELIFYVETNQIHKFIGVDIFEIGVNALVLLIFLFFLHLGIVEYGDIEREIRMRKEGKSEPITNSNEDKIGGHSKLIFFGSCAGFGAILVRLLYNFATNQLPNSFGGEFFEITVNVIPLIVFTLFIMGVLRKPERSNQKLV